MLRLPFNQNFLQFTLSITLLCSAATLQAGPVAGQGTWETTLQPRDIDGNGSVDAYYDTVLDVTWLADANYMATSNWDTSQAAGGWPEEQFIEYLAGFGHLGVMNWRLPSLSNSNQGTTGGELAHLYLNTLGNVPGTGLVNTGPFANMQATDYLYDYPVSRGGLGGQIYAQSFSMVAGTLTGNPGLAWAVADGDVQQATYTTPAYEIVELGTLGGAESRARDINNLGQIVGSSQDANSIYRAFLYQDGVMQDLGTLIPDNTGGSDAQAINDLGKVTGLSSIITPNGFSNMAFYFDGSQMLPLGSVPVDPYNEQYFDIAADINESGEIAVGQSDPSIHDTRFGLRTASGLATIESGALGSDPQALNWLGTTLGKIEQYYGTAQRLLLDGQFRVVANNTFDTRFGEDTIRLTDVSDQGLVAGSYFYRSCGSNFCNPTVSHGVVADAEDLPLDRSKLQEILGTREIRVINGDGEMIGTYAGRSVVKPVGGPSLFIDTLVDLQGWNITSLDLKALNERGDIVGSARRSSDNVTRAILLRRLNYPATNHPPLARATVDELNFHIGESVYLTGRIKDYDLDPLSVSWTLTQVPGGSTATLDDATSLTPSFTADVAGTYVATLVANDGSSDSNLASVQVSAQLNTRPQVSAGATPNQVRVGDVVRFNGSASDAENDPVTVLWTLTQAPAGSIAALSNPMSLNPTLSIDVAGTYGLSVIADDGYENSDPATLQFTATANSKPLATIIAIQPSRLLVGGLVRVYGSKSDPDNDTTTFRWTLTRPAGSAATLSNAGNLQPSFTADVAGTYVVTLVANDGRIDSDPATAQAVAYINSPPVADAGANQVVAVGASVQLSGSVADIDNDPTTVQWTLAQRPAGSAAVLSNPTTLTPVFTADVAGTYVAQLVANDGRALSNTASVQITAQQMDVAAIGVLQNAIAALQVIPPDRLKSVSARDRLVGNINDAIAKISSGNIARAQAILGGVQGKMDGCVLGGSPDKNDVLLACSDQNVVYPMIAQALDWLSRIV